MYPKKVKSLTLDKARMAIYNDPNMYDSQAIEDILVEDWGINCSVRSNPYIPDYVISGYMSLGEDMQYPTFIRSEQGPHLLYITGIPKNITSTEERAKFRFPGSEFISYWEDKKLGYLFQVISRELAFKHVINISKTKN